MGISYRGLRSRPAGVSKYRAVRTEVDGITFDSKREAARYQELKLLEKAGGVWNLALQPKFTFPFRYGATPTGKRGRYAEYIADFRYHIEPMNVDEWPGPLWNEPDWRLVVEDAKGMQTPKSRLQVALVEYFWGIKVRLV